jgi:hypothetical protein
MKRNLQLIVCLLLGGYKFAGGMEQPTVDQDYVKLVMSLDNHSLDIFNQLTQVNLDQESKKILDESIKRNTSKLGLETTIAFPEVHKDLLDLKIQYSTFRKKAFIGLGLLSAVNAGLFGWYAFNEGESVRSRLLDVAFSVTNGLSLFLLYKILSAARTQSKDVLEKYFIKPIDKDSNEIVHAISFVRKRFEDVCIPSISNEGCKSISQIFLISGAASYFSGPQSGIIAGLNVAAGAFAYYNPNFILGNSQLDKVMNIIKVHAPLEDQKD